MYILQQKLKELKIVLKDWSKGKYTNLEAQVKQLKDELHSIQQDIMRNPLDSRLAEEEKVIIERDSVAARTQEEMSREKSRALWLEAGDKNLPYFHRVIKSNRANNSINKVKKNDGSTVYS